MLPSTTHTTATQFHGATVANAREAAKIVGRPIAIALDTKGPEIRTGRNRGATEVHHTTNKQTNQQQTHAYLQKQDVPISLEKGSTVIVTIDPAYKVRLASVWSRVVLMSVSGGQLCRAHLPRLCKHRQWSDICVMIAACTEPWAVAKEGTRIFLDDGLIELVTKVVEADHLVCRVVSCLAPFALPR